MVHKSKKATKWDKHNMEAYLLGNIPHVQYTDIHDIFGGVKGYHEPAREYGERAWRINAKHGKIVYWDNGNGWSSIIKIESFDPKAFMGMKRKIDHLNKTDGWEQ